MRWSILALALLAAPLCAQQEDVQPKSRRKAVLEGTHVFRRILADSEFLPLTKFADLNDDPAKTLLIVLGDMDVLSQVPGGLKSFLDKGGAVLMASDRAATEKTARDAMVAVTGCSINTGGTLRLPFWDPDTGPQEMYRSHLFCPLVVPSQWSARELFRDPDAPGERYLVTTNTPSWLLLSEYRKDVQMLAYLSQKCQVETSTGQLQTVSSAASVNDQGIIRINNPNLRGFVPIPIFMVGTKGRVLLLADHSLFINEMMLPDDNQNVEFTDNCLRFLNGAEKRDRALFLEDGRIQTTFDVPMKSVTPTLEEILQLLGQPEVRRALLITLEEEMVQREDPGWYDDRASDLLDRVGLYEGRLAAWVVGLSALALLFYSVYRLGIRGRFAHDTTVPPLTTTVGENFPIHGLTEQRAKALVKARNALEPAVGVVRGWFAREGIDTGAEAPTPAFEVSGGWWQRRALQRRLRALFELACGRATQRVSPGELWSLQRELEQLSGERRRGVWDVV